MTEEQPQTSPEEEEQPEEQDRSIMDRLRSRRAAVGNEATTQLDIPGYEGELVATYRLMDSKELDAIGRKVTKQFPRDRAQQALFGSVDTLIAACVELGFRQNGTYTPLQEVAGTDYPVTYDSALAEFFGFETKTAREVLFGVFVGREPAILRHQMELAEWMTGAEGDLAQDLLGER